MGLTDHSQILDDVEGLAKSIILLLTDAPMREQLGRQGADRIKEKFEIDRIAVEHVKYYQQVIHGTKGISQGE